MSVLWLKFVKTGTNITLTLTSVPGKKFEKEFCIGLYLSGRINYPWNIKLQLRIKSGKEGLSYLPDTSQAKCPRWTAMLFMVLEIKGHTSHCIQHPRGSTLNQICELSPFRPLCYKMLYYVHSSNKQIRNSFFICTVQK